MDLNHGALENLVMNVLWNYSDDFDGVMSVNQVWEKLNQLNTKNNELPTAENIKVLIFTRQNLHESLKQLQETLNSETKAASSVKGTTPEVDPATAEWNAIKGSLEKIFDYSSDNAGVNLKNLYK